MYHMVKEVASLIKCHRKMTAFLTMLTVTYFKTESLYTAKLGRLTCFISLRDIVNIAKIHRLYSWDVRGWCSDEKEGIFHSVDPFKEKTNQHRTLHTDPQRLGQSHYNKEMAVISNMSIPK